MNLSLTFFFSLFSFFYISLQHWTNGRWCYWGLEGAALCIVLYLQGFSQSIYEPARSTRWGASLIDRTGNTGVKFQTSSRLSVTHLVDLFPVFWSGGDRNSFLYDKIGIYFHIVWLFYRTGVWIAMTSKYKSQGGFYWHFFKLDLLLIFRLNPTLNREQFLVNAPYFQSIQHLDLLMKKPAINLFLSPCNSLGIYTI